jgi:hypothetical protein
MAVEQVLLIHGLAITLCAEYEYIFPSAIPEMLIPDGKLSCQLLTARYETNETR